jgi:GAF domain-containing protein
MPIDAGATLTVGIGALCDLDPARDLAHTVQRVVQTAKTLFGADGAGLMLADADGALRSAGASDEPTQTVEAGQERLAEGPGWRAFHARSPVALRDVTREGDGEITEVLLGASFKAALSVPIELAGGPIGTLDIYGASPRRWEAGEVAAVHAYSTVVACALGAAAAAQAGGRLAAQLRTALDHRLLVGQARSVAVTREGIDAAGHPGRRVPSA